MSGSFGEDRLLSLADPALRIDGVDAVEVVLLRSDSALTRFAESLVHQNTTRADADASVRVVVDGTRVGSASVSELTSEAVRSAAERAREAARLVPPDPEFPGLASPAGYQPAGRDDPVTADCAPAERAGLVRRMLAELPDGVMGAGAVETGEREIAVVNSLGVRGYHRATRAAASVLASGADSTGYAEDAASALTDLDVAELGMRAAGKVELGRDPRSLAPGDYPVVLEPGATVVLAQWLAYTAFSGKAFLEGRSPLSGRLGEQLCSSAITIVDDALSPLMPGIPFDFEGTPKRRVPFLEAGVAVGVAHDRRTARMAGMTSTGHALPQPNADGGIPLHVLMEPGEQSMADLIAGLDRGLVVTRFHYTNLVHPVTSTITGMTRDGTFLVESGKIVSGVKNLRFTQSILDALSDVQAVGADTRVASDLFFGAARTPALRLGSFSFTSATEH